jgi:hypothetical protein
MMKSNRQKELELLGDIGYRDQDEPVTVETGDQMLHVSLKDGRIITTPLAWYPFLLEATPSVRSNVEVEGVGIFWPDLNEGLSIRGMLMGWRPPQNMPRRIRPLVIEKLPEDETA